jgi:hypothetical protein
MKKIFLVCFLLVGIVVYGQNLVVLYPSKDVSLGYHDNYNTANNNYSTASQLAAFVIEGHLGGVNSNRGLLHFDLDEIPEESEILSAKLSLFAFNNYSGSFQLSEGHYGDNSCNLKMVTESWGNSTVTWNNQPMTTDDYQVVLEQSTSPNQNYTDIDVTNMFQYLSDNRDLNHGLKLSLINEVLGNNLSFHSKESTDSEKRPKLEITFKARTNSIIDFNSEVSDFLIYPNPIVNELSFKLNNTNDYKEIKLYNSEGKLLKVIETKGEKEVKLDVSDFDNGVYFSVFGTKKVKFVISR